MADQASAISGHYGRRHLGDLIRDGLEASGKASGTLTPEDLAPVDQFHIGSIEQTRELSRMAGMQPGSTVLDVGGGLGGPARVLAYDIGCRVTVLDLTPEFGEVGTWLTERCALDDRVVFKVGNALDLPFGDGAFDAVWTQHSSMNIDDKERLYAEIGRVLRSGGRFAFHEIMAGSVQPIHFPVPWAPEPSISFLREPAAIRNLLPTLGFEELAWRDTSEPSMAWFRERIGAARAAGPPHLGLHLLLGPSAATMLGNVLRNLEEGRLVVVQAVFARR